MMTAREAALDWVRRTLSAEGLASAESAAEAFIGVADEFSVPVELLVGWIQECDGHKEVTVERWIRWCKKYRESAARLAVEFGREPESMEKLRHIETSRQEHLAWAKERALSCVARGDLIQAVASMQSDLCKHVGFSAPGTTVALHLGILEIQRGAEAVRHWIEGFN